MDTAVLKVTDAEQTRVVLIQPELAKSVGVFKDMIETVPSGSDSEPVRTTLTHQPLKHRLYWMNRRKFSISLLLGYFTVPNSVFLAVPHLTSETEVDNILR
jgi:hypothetical protein